MGLKVFANFLKQRSSYEANLHTDVVCSLVRWARRRGNREWRREKRAAGNRVYISIKRERLIKSEWRSGIFCYYWNRLIRTHSFNHKVFRSSKTLRYYLPHCVSAEFRSFYSRITPVIVSYWRCSTKFLREKIRNVDVCVKINSFWVCLPIRWKIRRLIVRIRKFPIYMFGSHFSWLWLWLWMIIKVSSFVFSSLLCLSVLNLWLRFWFNWLNRFFNI